MHPVSTLYPTAANPRYEEESCTRFLHPHTHTHSPHTHTQAYFNMSIIIIIVTWSRYSEPLSTNYIYNDDYNADAVDEDKDDDCN